MNLGFRSIRANRIRRAMETLKNEWEDDVYEEKDEQTRPDARGIPSSKS
jgi:hypothetical protein